VNDGKILLISGREVEPFNLKLEDIDIMDIAHSLSMQCRYAGHVPFFYSVAEHCVRAVHLCAEVWFQEDIEDLRGHELLRSILLHDADEAYLQDMVSPVKNLPVMEAYRQAGDRAHALVAEKYEAPSMVEGAEDFRIVQKFDMAAYEWERGSIRSGRVSGLNPSDAASAFLGAWYLLRPSTFG
jgi:uncharacterized protein